MNSREHEALDLLTVPLAGVHAVEASAGTGKTYNITGLYLRLLLETDLAPENILVVTYTVAATAELRTRIRRGILEALEAFRDSIPETEPATPLLARLVARFPDRPRAVRRLANALRTFDGAAIFTIHGFCQRVLAESAFESRAALEWEMLTDQSELLAECVQDFWRNETYAGSPSWVRHLLDASLDPETLQREIAGLVGKAFDAVLLPEDVPDTADDEKRYAALFARAREQWGDERETILEHLRSPELDRNVYRADQIAKWADSLSAELGCATPGLALFDRFTRFTTADLEHGTKKNRTTPTHPFFVTCTEIDSLRTSLQAAYARRLALLRARLLEFCNREIHERKAQRRVRWFDDLLLDLEAALASGPAGAALAEALRERYGAALIDEFQDTDALQYSIFRHIYGTGEAPVFLVGDPKQAIYAFRGADVFAYLQARRDARGRYTLDENYRSDRSVVHGVNEIFHARDNPFVLEDIPFHLARPAHPDRARPLLEATGLPPVRAWLLPRDEDHKALTIGEATDWLTEATADEIARLLDAKAALPCAEGPPVELRCGHVAVLVRNHDQGQRVRKALSARGIPAVEESQESIFASSEAAEVERVLAAIAEPEEERLIRGALSTTLLGFTADRLLELSDSEQGWDAETASFRRYRSLWLADGFGRMFRQLLREREVPARLLQGPAGERHLTNVLQIGELLTHEAASAHSGSEKLLQWLATRRRLADDDGAPPAEHLLRLESDSSLVQITTLHAAKGLEYPVVFVPFPRWTRTSNERSPVVAFHREGTNTGRPTLDFGSPEQAEHRRIAEREALAEDVRLFYVALTRAKYHCTFAWGAINRAERTAPAWLFHGGADPSALHPYQELSDAEIRAALEVRASTSHGALGVETLARPDAGRPRRAPLTTGDSRRPLRARAVGRKIARRWQITSFSALRGGRSVDLADRDDRATPPVEIAEPRPDIFGFPRGARPGVCLHRIFELWDFTDPDPGNLRRLVASTLDEFRFSPSWIPTIEKMVRDVTATSLDTRAGLRLSDVPRERRLDELEFHYPAGRLTLAGLNDLLRAYGYPEVPMRAREADLPRPLVDGYVKGYIDVVFEAGGRYYLADYKSNWLGPDVEAYRPRALDAVMGSELYTLQYVTYTLALHRLLRLRLTDYDYDRHVGGAFYLFLRGMRPERGPTSGVFFDRPPPGLIAELDDRLGSGRRPRPEEGA